MRVFKICGYFWMASLCIKITHEFIDILRGFPSTVTLNYYLMANKHCTLRLLSVVQL